MFRTLFSSVISQARTAFCPRRARLWCARGLQRAALWLPVFVVFVFCADPLAAQTAQADFAAGVQAYKDARYEMAHRIFGGLAAEDDPRAQFALGLLFDNGQGVSQDDRLARSWYARSAGQGFAKAQFNLALMLEAGRGGAADPETARDWFLRAAEAGNDDARTRVMRLVESGDAVAARELGRMYFYGRGVQTNRVLAGKLFARAAEAGDRDAMFYLAWQIESAQKPGKPLPAEALRWYTEAARAGHAGAMYNLAVHYRIGIAVSPAPDRAKALYTRAAELGHARAAFSMGLFYDLGGPWNSDPEAARRWYAQAAELGVAAAHVNLAALESEQAKTAADWASVRQHLEAAEAAGHPLAADNLARLTEFMPDQPDQPDQPDTQISIQ